MKKLKVILIGAGNRGERYTDIMADMPEKYEVVAVAEPIESRRKSIQRKHHIPDELCFTDAKELLAKGKIADVAVIATMDKEHYDFTMQAISLKYDLLLEKPVSPNPIECKRIADYADALGVKVVVCHVLRYAPFFITLKKAIMEGKIGDIISINHEECVGPTNKSHAFVRGNWGNSDRSSCMLLQKSCHDMDILQWLIGKKCKEVQSFGALNYFKKENAPQGSPEYCIEGCPVAESCPYDAVKMYLKSKSSWLRTTCTREAEPTDEMVEKAIRTTQYGKCVFKCDNNVVDRQTVNLLFEDDITVTFTMNGFNKAGRYIHIMGTKGEIRGAMDDSTPITIYDLATNETTVIPIQSKDGIMSGHGGGDNGIVESFYDYIANGEKGISISDISTSVENHLIVFAAEKSRMEHSVVSFEEYVKSLKTPLDYAMDACDTMMRKFQAEELPPKGHFHYHQGVFLSGMYQTWQKCREKRYFQYIKDWVDSIVDENGEIHKFNPKDMDDIQPGILLYPLLERTGDIKYKKALDRLIACFETYPVNKEGGRWHKDVCPNQMWLDGLYMGGPICAEYAEHFNEPQYWDVVTEQVLMICQKTKDRETGLWYHAWDCDKKAEWADVETGCSKEFWGRSIGWVPVAVLNMLDFMPGDYGKRPELEKVVRELLEAVCRYQSEDGRWYQVVDKGNQAGNWLENSCSCLFVAAICKAVRKGILDKSYLAQAKKGYDAVIASLTYENADIQIGNVCVGTGVGDYAHYCNRPTSTNDLHGVGAFLIMCTEVPEKF